MPNEGGMPRDFIQVGLETILLAARAGRNLDKSDPIVKRAIKADWIREAKYRWYLTEKGRLEVHLRKLDERGGMLQRLAGRDVEKGVAAGYAEAAKLADGR